jgi:restriction system protein
MTSQTSVEALPRYSDLMLPTLRAVETLGGSGNAREITAKTLGEIGATDEQLAVTYDARPEKSILLDRIDWARSYCKLGGALDSPRRNLFLITSLGREIVQLPEQEARSRLFDLDRQVRIARRRQTPPTVDTETSDVADDEVEDAALEDQILRRLHRLSPEAFEEFCLFLLRSFGLELTRVGRSGDEGIDGIGTAPLSPVLSATVAVQAKRWEPSTVVSRDKVALFQRDAAAKGAERAVMVTLGKFSEPARRASLQATPTVDLIDGQRLCELMKQNQIGVVLAINEDWFDRFEQTTP